MISDSEYLKLFEKAPKDKEFIYLERLTEDNVPVPNETAGAQAADKLDQKTQQDINNANAKQQSQQPAAAPSQNTATPPTKPQANKATKPVSKPTNQKINVKAGDWKTGDKQASVHVQIPNNDKNQNDENQEETQA